MKAVRTLIEKASSANTRNMRRTNVADPWFDGKRVIATDGHILAIVKAEGIEKNDTPGFIPAEILKRARKDGGQIKLNGTASAAGLSVERETQEKPIPTPSIARIIRSARKSTVKVALNVALLLDLAAALNDGKSRSLQLCIGDPTGAVIVKGNKGYGAIMPVRW